jgi:hypothetical protein
MNWNYPPQLRRRDRWSAFACLCALLAFAASGCGRSHESYVPTIDIARASLERALDAWKAGGAPGRIEPAAGEAAIQAVDRDWTAGQKLASYEIVQELPREEGPRKFSVRLSLAGGKSLEVTYYVVGQDPVWVFRDRDYAQTTTM